MANRRLLQLIVGAVLGAYTVGACLPILLMLPMSGVASTLTLIVGGGVILAGTAEDVRHAVGRCLVMLGSTLIILPILSLVLGVLIVAPTSELAMKSDKVPPYAGPSSRQIIAACVAFGAGSLVAVTGMIIIMNGERDRFSNGYGRKVSPVAVRTKPSNRLHLVIEGSELSFSGLAAEHSKSAVGMQEPEGAGERPKISLPELKLSGEPELMSATVRKEAPVLQHASSASINVPTRPITPAAGHMVAELESEVTRQGPEPRTYLRKRSLRSFLAKPRNSGSGKHASTEAVEAPPPPEE